MGEREYLVAKASRVLYREATSDEKVTSDRTSRNAAYRDLPVLGAGAGAATAVLRRRITPVKMAAHATVGGATGLGLGELARRRYKHAEKRHGVWTYDFEGGGRATVAGDGSTMFGNRAVRVKKFPRE